MMRSTIEYGRGDIRPRSLSFVGVVMALGAITVMLLADGVWFAIAAGILFFGAIFAIVGVWAERKVRSGEFRTPQVRSGSAR